MNDTILRDLRLLMNSPRSDSRPERARHEQRLGDQREAAVKAFAALNGWELSDLSFPPGRFGKTRHGTSHSLRGSDPGYDLFDHSLYFLRRVAGKHARVGAAIAGQPYSNLKQLKVDIDQMSQHYQGCILAHIAPMPYASFHYPGSTALVVITEPGVDVKWLPEQMSCVEFAERGANQASTTSP
jgi:hypothetical protein